MSEIDQAFEELFRTKTPPIEFEKVPPESAIPHGLSIQPSVTRYVIVDRNHRDELRFLNDKGWCYRQEHALAMGLSDAEEIYGLRWASYSIGPYGVATDANNIFSLSGCAISFGTTSKHVYLKQLYMKESWIDWLEGDHMTSLISTWTSRLYDARKITGDEELRSLFFNLVFDDVRRAS